MTSKITRCIRVLLCSLLVTATPVLSALKASELSDNATESLIRPYTANYVISRRGSNYGTGVKEVKQIAEKRYLLSYRSEVSFLFLSDKRNESSQLLLENERLFVDWYRFQRLGTGKDKDDKYYFDRQTHQVKDRNEVIRLGREGFDSSILDQLSYQLQLEMDFRAGKRQFDYQAINRKGVLRRYQFEILASEETLSLPFGEVNTVKLHRITDNTKRKTYAWFCPQLDYLMVRLQQFEDNKENFNIALKDVHWN